MTNQLQFSGEEQSANVIVKRECSRLQRREVAVGAAQKYPPPPKNGHRASDLVVLADCNDTQQQAYIIQVWYHRQCRSSASRASQANMMQLHLHLKQLTMDSCVEIDGETFCTIPNHA